MSLCCKSLVVDYSMSDGDGKRDLEYEAGDSFPSKVSSGYILGVICYSFKGYMFSLLIV